MTIKDETVSFMFHNDYRNIVTFFHNLHRDKCKFIPVQERFSRIKPFHWNTLKLDTEFSLIGVFNVEVIAIS